MSTNTYYPSGDSPGLVKTIAVLTLINGIVNIFWGLIATVSVTASIILICLAPFKLLSDPPQPVQPSTTIAILEILCVLTFNVFSMIVGILALVFYNDPQVKQYFADLNGIPYPVAPEAPIPPAPPAVPEPKIPQERKVAAEKTDNAPEGNADSPA
jgi:hypothetical protein